MRSAPRTIHWKQKAQATFACRRGSRNGEVLMQASWSGSVTRGRALEKHRGPSRTEHMGGSSMADASILG